MCFKITCNTEKIVYFQRTYIFIFVEHFMKKACTSWGMYDVLSFAVLIIKEVTRLT